MLNPIPGSYPIFANWFGDFLLYLRIFWPISLVSISFTKWPIGVSNHRFLSVQDSFLRSYQIFYIWLADFFCFCSVCGFFLVNFTFVSILFEMWPWGASNHRFLGMLNPFPRSYPIYYIYLADYFRSCSVCGFFLDYFTFVSILFEIWPWGVSNHRFLDMLNPFPRSYPTFDNLLADFLPNLTESSTMFAHFLLNFGKKVKLARKSAKTQTFLSMLNS